MKKTTILWLLALLAIPATGQQSPVNSDVYPGKKAGIAILTGATRFLENLEIRTVTLAPNASAETGERHDGVEELVVVKSGTLGGAHNNAPQSLGAGSVARTLRGDRHRRTAAT